MKLIVFGDYHYVSDQNYSTDTCFYDYSQEFVDLKNQFHEHGIASIFKEEADYYISLGDLTNLGLDDEIEDVYNLIEKTGKLDKFIHVFGNHDLYTSPAEHISKLTGQDYNYSIDTENVKMIFYVSAVDQDPVEWGGVMTEDDRAFLEKEISEAKGKPIMIFAHHPIHDTVRNSCLEKHYIEPKDQIRQVLSSHKGKGIFVAGHTHAESLVTDGDWTFVNIDCFLDHPRYSIIDIGKDEISISSRQVEISEDLDEKRRIIGSHMPHFMPRPANIGTSLDREGTIKL